jgi:serine/threonine protein kinase
LTPERWNQIEELFHRAAECQPGQRITFLDQACHGDAELRREVEVLISSDEAAANCMQAAVHLELDTFAFPLIGHTVGHYRILSGLDGGGMGLVYRAEDIKLGRQVALKFLPEESAKEPEALSRFEREARSASALEHPNICPIYEFGEYEGEPFLVMPLLQGQTLKELIASSRDRTVPLPLDQLLVYAAQLAEGLEAAHRRGFVHRDIKPGNIFITNQGQAKILDFGLAKFVQNETDNAQATSRISAEQLLWESANPSLSRTGSALGTTGYMSPEQVRGEKLDSRTDLFSFGLVLFEMSTGKHPFDGGTSPVIQDAILNESQPSLRGINPRIPVGFEKIVNKALEKDRQARYQTASEVHADLEKLKQQLVRAHPVRSVGVLSLAALTAISLIVVFWTARRQPHLVAPEFKLRQLTTNSAENHILNGSISPDGKYLAYTDLRGLYLKRIDTMQVHPVDLQGQTLEAYNNNPAWFPDSKKFLINLAPRRFGAGTPKETDASIWEVSVPQGEARRLLDNAFVWAVSPDASQIAFAANYGPLGPREVWLMSPNGENVRKLYETTPDRAIGPFLWSPDGQRLSYVSADEFGDTAMSRDLHGQPPTTVFPNAELQNMPGSLLLPDGRAIYSIREPGTTDDTCNFWTARIDPRTLKPVEKFIRLTNWTGFCMDPGSVTSDGKRLAFAKWATHATVYVADLDASGNRIVKSRHFTLDETGSSPIDWTPDSKAIIFSSKRNGAEAIFKQRLGQDGPELISSTPESLRDAQLSPDGEWILWQIVPQPEVRSQPRQLFRAPIGGGSPEHISQVGAGSQFSCARLPSILCIVAERTEDRRQVILHALDPLLGPGGELLRFDLDPNDEWDGRISPDGTRFAVIAGPAEPIRVLSLRRHPEQVIPTKGANTKQSLRWSANGKGFFITNGIKGGSQLLHIDMRGNSTILWENDGGFFPWGVQSPDGKHLAIQGSSEQNNIWLMENF